MAKPSALKRRTVSTHSRAFRRAASPPPKDPNPTSTKSAKDSAPATEHWLYTAQAAGVHKKVAKGKTLTRQQKQRQVKALEFAERNSAKHEVKVEKSKGRARKVAERAKAWEEIDDVAVEMKKAGDAKVDGEMEGGEDEWEDEVEGQEGEGDVSAMEQGLDGIIAENGEREAEEPDATVADAPTATSAAVEEIDEVT
ncbi:hypothetical protein B0A48_01407 [Cryoendolithus antarcticus]|uniref:Ribosome biogenesis protein Alb1 n=1 Tax=Cryoendolithus antarcticus TaxID=1507870 RepID=A0A1V8TT75_9PEZI|nr:hypothetical protein B0A48_01407 [Cryoendolithus antarcticus]